MRRLFEWVFCIRGLGFKEFSCISVVWKRFPVNSKVIWPEFARSSCFFFKNASFCCFDINMDWNVQELLKVFLRWWHKTFYIASLRSNPVCSLIIVPVHFWHTIFEDRLTSRSSTMHFYFLCRVVFHRSFLATSDGNLTQLHWLQKWELLHAERRTCWSPTRSSSAWRAVYLWR